MSDLKEFYRQALTARVTEIEGALARLDDDPHEAAAIVRRAAHSLRGSGGTYGFPEVTEAAGVVEDAADADLPRTAHSLLTVLRGIATSDAARSRILIVDDDPAIALLLRAVLSAPDRDITIAQSAAEAATHADGSFDLVLLDLLLPDGDGRTVLRAMRDAGSRAHIVVLSGKSAALTEAECLSAGADAYVTKPFDPEAIAAFMTRVLEQQVAP